MVYKGVGILVGTLLLIGVAVLFVLSRLCSSNIKAQELSPDAKYIARIEESSCGAVTRFDTDVMLLKAKPRLGIGVLGRSNGNVFTLTASSSHLSLRWDDATTLVVQCSGCDSRDVHEWKSRWERVSLRYIMK
jgi:hypothetical protein